METIGDEHCGFLSSETEILVETNQCIVYLDCDLLGLLTSPQFYQIGLYYIRRLNLLCIYCHLTYCIRHVYTYLLCVLTTESSCNIQTSVIVLYIKMLCL